MLPSSLVSAYQQYKKDTDSVAAWLASTAKACGYPSDLLGKARKDAKKPKSCVSIPLETTPSYLIAVKDFVPLAEFIFASSKPLVSVPQSFVDTIDRVIHSDASHSYFVEVLKKVRDVLRPCMPAATQSLDPLNDMSNWFKDLNTNEHTPEFLDLPELERPRNAQGDDNIYEVEPQKSFEDALVAYAIMMNDLNRIRSYIKWIWTNHRDGHFELANAAVATNTGIELARNLMDQVLPIFEDQGGAVAMLEKFSFICARREGFSADDILSWGPDGKNEDVYEVADRTYLNASLLLDALTRTLPPNHLPIYKEGTFGTYNPQSDRKLKKGRAKFNEDLVVLAEFFPEAVTVARHVPNYLVEDEFIRGIRELDQTGKIPFYLIYATQILLDVHHIIRDRASTALDSLIKQTATMDDELNRHTIFHMNLKNENWPASNDRALRKFQKSLQLFGQDPVFLAKQRIAQKAGSPAISSGRHRLLVHSPILCGLVLYHFRAGMHDLGIAVANAWGSIAYLAHLYNALRNECLLDRKWADMEAVQTILGDFNLFTEGRPVNKKDYLQRLLLHMGYSASAFTAPSRAGPRGIKNVAPVSCMFVEKYLRGSRQVDLSPEHVDKILSRSRFQEEGSVKDGTLVLTQIDDANEIKKRQSKQRKKVAEGALLSPGELLKSLVLVLGAETLEFSFPYLLMHRQCWEFLRHIKEACDRALKQLYSAAYIEKESQLPFVVGYIFMAGSEDQGGDGALIRAAAEVVNSLIESEAGEMVLGVVRNSYGLQFEFVFEDERNILKIRFT
ncbi:hypothetical protein B0I35DRAFT_472101 [Stachybotrys elegans]|uniref:DUF6604 domain-containing protein n=1 Tax=Stachybotrys elegans TaxID=80388 RepID=A0A8K0WL59_9HYPO|nr:hypothetical protein B0I35DRAFT_472101 [Stachybotrys elegans]